MAYTNVNEALAAVETGVCDVLNDQPHLAGEEDSVYWDMAQAIMWDCSPAVARELARVTGVTLVR
jgi:hypothetical protein